MEGSGSDQEDEMATEAVKKALTASAGLTLHERIAKDMAEYAARDRHEAEVLLAIWVALQENKSKEAVVLIDTRLQSLEMAHIAGWATVTGLEKLAKLGIDPERQKNFIVESLDKKSKKPSSSGSPKSSSVCYSCGKSGHWSSNCPDKKGGAAKK